MTKAHHASRVRDSEPPCRSGPRLCGVGARGLARVARIFGYVSSRRRWSFASISSNCEEYVFHVREGNRGTERRLTLVPSGSGIVRQTVLSSISRTDIPSSISLSVILTVFQLTSSLVGEGWYVTFMSSFATPGISNLAVTCLHGETVQIMVAMNASIATTLTLVPSEDSLNSTLHRRAWSHQLVCRRRQK